MLADLIRLYRSFKLDRRAIHVEHVADVLVTSAVISINDFFHHHQHHQHHHHHHQISINLSFKRFRSSPKFCRTRLQFKLFEKVVRSITAGNEIHHEQPQPQNGKLSEALNSLF